MENVVFVGRKTGWVAIGLVVLVLLQWGPLVVEAMSLPAVLHEDVVGMKAYSEFNHHLSGGMVLFMAHNHQSPKLLLNHVILGVVTMLAAVVKFAWEMRWNPWRYGGILWPASVFVVGVLLVVYTE